MNQEHYDEWMGREDDTRPATRGEVRNLARSIRNDMKWTAVMLLVGNQALSHIALPTAAGFVGAALAAVVWGAKVFFARI